MKFGIVESVMLGVVLGGLAAITFELKEANKRNEKRAR